MAEDLSLGHADRPAADLSRRIVVPGTIGIAGAAPASAHDVAAVVGLPHKHAWIAAFAPEGVLKGGEVDLSAASAGLPDGLRLHDVGLTVWPLASRAAVRAVGDDLARRGLPLHKVTDLRQYASKVAVSPEGFVLAARKPHENSACALLSLFREVEVDHQGRVSYHVHLEDVIDLSGGHAGEALAALFAVQAEADLAALAHAMSAAGLHGSIAIACESNNADTHDHVEQLAELIEESCDRLMRHPEFCAAVGREIEFEIPNFACWPEMAM